MSDLEIKTIKQQGISTAAGQSATGFSVVENKSAKPIFNANNSGNETSLEGVLDGFEKTVVDSGSVENGGNTDAVIQKNEENVRSTSGKRVATNGKYKVMSGDNLYEIAKDFGIEPVDLLYANKETLSNNTALRVGQILIVDKSVKRPTLSTEERKALRETKKQETKQKDIAKFSNVLNEIDVPEGIKNSLSKITNSDCSKLSNGEIIDNLLDLSVEDLQKTLEQLRNSGNAAEIQDFCKNLKKKLKTNNSEDDFSRLFKDNLKIMTTLLDKDTEPLKESISKVLGKDCSEMTAKELVQALSQVKGKDRARIEKSVLDVITGPEISLYEQADNEHDSMKQLCEYIGLSADELKELKNTNKEDAYKKFGEALLNKKLADLNENDPNSKFNKFLSELKLSNPDMPEEKLIKRAKYRVKLAYDKAMAGAGIDLVLVNNNIDGYKALTRTAVDIDNDDLEFEDEGTKSGEVYAAATEMLLEDASVSNEHKTQIANVNIECAEVLGMNDIDTDSFADFSASVLIHADSEHIQQHIEANVDKIDVLEEVINDLAVNSTDSARQEIYVKAQETVAEVKHEIETTGCYKGQPVKANNGKSNNASELNYNSNEARNVADIRNASETYYSENGVTNPISNNDADVQTAHRSAHKIGTELSIVEPIRYNPDRIKKIVKDVNNSIGQFSNLSQEEQAKVNLYLTSAPPHALVSLMLSGNSAVQKFLLQYVSIDVIANTVAVNDIDSFSKNIRQKLAEHVKSKVDAGTLKENQMTHIEEKIMEFYSKTV